MKAIMVMYDSLNRHMLPPYGCDWVHAPNFQRLSRETATFDRSFVGSMPCMPARRELHTGRYNFLHRSWGPVEPFDDSMPEILKENGVYTHLVSDHYHYWEEGGCTYHTRYSSWELLRGQEVDPWKGLVDDPETTQPNPDTIRGEWARHDWINRQYIKQETDMPQVKTFDAGLAFIEDNKDADNWFLQLETFDPHEPYYCPSERFKKLYPFDKDPQVDDWPDYRAVDEEKDDVQHMRYQSAALHSMCDDQLGRVLEMMDHHDMWEDTMLIVNTDHGFLLGEHDCWAKCWMPFYNEVACTPLFIWDPRSGVKDERRTSLVQTIDLAPTLLDFFNVEIPADMLGKPLRDTISHDKPVREAGLFGIHGGQVNVTDGRYVYMRASANEDNQPIFEYTLMPTNMHHTFLVEQLQQMEKHPAFNFTKGCPVMRIPSAGTGFIRCQDKNQLFDCENDPQQKMPITDDDVTSRMIALLRKLLHENDAPLDQYQRLGLQA